MGASYILFEITESLFWIGPAVLAVLLLWKPSRHGKGLSLQFLVSYILAFGSLGLLLTRLTASCASSASQCGDGLLAVTRVPGIIRTCVVCLKNGNAGLMEYLNRWSIHGQAISAALCILVSFVATIRLVLWFRRNKNG